MVPKGCEEPEYSIKNNLGIVHLEEGNEGIEAVDRASTVQLRNAFGFWVCSRKYSGSTGDLGPFVPLVLRLNPGKIGSSVMKNINGILMSQKQSSGSSLKRAPLLCAYVCVGGVCVGRGKWPLSALHRTRT